MVPSEIVLHFAFEHGFGKLLELLWQVVNFNSTILTKELYSQTHNDDSNAESRKFTEKEIVGEIENSASMKFATTLKKVGMNQIVIQPAACFVLR